jgi:hypothetical protein
MNSTCLSSIFSISFHHLLLYFPYLFTIFFRIFHIFSLFSSIFSISFHYSTYFSSVFFISFHYSTCLCSIFSISFHISTYISTIFSISFVYWKYGRKEGKYMKNPEENSDMIGKIQKKLWKDMENMEERQVQ